MIRIGVRELRQNASRYLALVTAGHTVEVTEHGELIALLTPVESERTARADLVAAGRVIPAAAPTGAARWGRSVPVLSGDPTNAELLQREREERR